MNSQLTIAAHILAVLAHRSDQGAVTSEVLAKGFGTSPVVVRRILAQLKQAGLVESRSGTGGGSILARPAEEITLRDAFAALNTDEASVLKRHPAQCEEGVDIVPVIAEILNELFVEAEEALLNTLGNVSVDKLTKEISKRVGK